MIYNKAIIFGSLKTLLQDMELYFSNDSNDFGTADTIIQFENTPEPQTIIFQN